MVSPGLFGVDCFRQVALRDLSFIFLVFDFCFDMVQVGLFR